MTFEAMTTAERLGHLNGLIKSGKVAKTEAEARSFHEAVLATWHETPSWGERINGRRKPSLALSDLIETAEIHARAGWCAAMDGDGAKSKSELRLAVQALESAKTFAGQQEVYRTPGASLRTGEASDV